MEKNMVSRVPLWIRHCHLCMEAGGSLYITIGWLCVKSDIARLLKLNTLVRSPWKDWCPDWCSRVWFPHFTHTPINSRISEANIWSNSYDHLTSVGGQRGGCQQLLLRKGDDEDKKGGKAERVYGCNIGTWLYPTKPTNDWKKWVRFQSVYLCLSFSSWNRSDTFYGFYCN